MTLDTETTGHRGNLYDTLFRIGMWWRILYSLLRIVLGLSLLRFVGMPLSDIIYKIMGHELVEDPSDFLVQIFNLFLQHSSFTITYFLATYFIFWGTIDVFLSVEMLKNNVWAFPISMYLILMFILYEIYRFSHTHSYVLAYIIVIDVALVWLIRKKYLKLESTKMS